MRNDTFNNELSFGLQKVILARVAGLAKVSNNLNSDRDTVNQILKGELFFSLSGKYGTADHMIKTNIVLQN